MIFDEDAKLLERVGDAFSSCFESFHDPPKTVILNLKQQLFFRFAVVIKSSETDAGRARDVAHRRRVITLLGKNPRRGAKNKLKFLVATTQVGFGVCAHLSCWERGRPVRHSVRSTLKTRSRYELVRASRSVRTRTSALPATNVRIQTQTAC